ncbi:T9SS type A sorting domain-containing protein [candidate division KSB1 bacterium]|nr:T9SS type A sorting domain-containing protein [candidate division KSB1 bacterium]
MTGKKVRTLVNENKIAGNHSVVWDGLDNNNTGLSSGIYFYKLNVGDVTRTYKMIKVE